MSATRVEGGKTMETMETICSEQSNQQQPNRKVVHVRLKVCSARCRTNPLISKAARETIARWCESEKHNPRENGTV